jgi:predicted nucleic acid-binding Zn ribbon protein
MSTPFPGAVALRCPVDGCTNVFSASSVDCVAISCLPCGHSVCGDCFAAIETAAGGSQLKCFVCGAPCEQFMKNPALSAAGEASVSKRLKVAGSDEHASSCDDFVVPPAASSCVLHPVCAITMYCTTCNDVLCPECDAQRHSVVCGVPIPLDALGCAETVARVAEAQYQRLHRLVTSAIQAKTIVLSAETDILPRVWELRQSVQASFGRLRAAIDSAERLALAEIEKESEEASKSFSASIDSLTVSEGQFGVLAGMLKSGSVVSMASAVSVANKCGKNEDCIPAKLLIREHIGYFVDEVSVHNAIANCLQVAANRGKVGCIVFFVTLLCNWCVLLWVTVHRPRARWCSRLWRVVASFDVLSLSLPDFLQAAFAELNPKSVLEEATQEGLTRV